MRKLGNQYIQKGTGKKVRKKPFELITELSEKKTKRNIDDKTGEVFYTKKGKPLISKKDLAKKLKISDRTLRSYKKYFESLQNPTVKLSKNDRKPSKEKQKQIEKLLSKVAKSKKIMRTRDAGNIIASNQVGNFRKLISQTTWNKLKPELTKNNFFGFLVRINILFTSKTGTHNDWLTYVISTKSLKTINEFLTDQIYKRVTNTKKSTITSFEIIETIITVTTKDYEPNVRKKNNKK